MNRLEIEVLVSHGREHLRAGLFSRNGRFRDPL